MNTTAAHITMVTTMATTFITEHAMGELVQYNVPAIVSMLIKWAAEDGVTVTGLAHEDVLAIVESHRTALSV